MDAIRDMMDDHHREMIKQKPACCQGCVHLDMDFVTDGKDVMAAYWQPICLKNQPMTDPQCPDQQRGI